VSARDDERLLRDAIALSRAAPPSESAFSVGCVIARDGDVLATGYSRERGARSHAEAIALEKAAELGRDVRGATLYSSMEPCSVRASGAHDCAAYIIDAGIARVVFALREPPVFVDGHGAEVLARAGVDVVELGAEGGAVAEINAHVMR